MSQKTKRKKLTRDVPQCEFRKFTVVPSSINPDERSVEGIIASETPVMEMDWDRYMRVPRTLLMTGAEFPASRQMPLLDSHNRYSVKDQLGSIRDIRTEGENLVGKLVFSASAEDEWTKVREGHVTDISVGFQVLKQVFVPEKTTQKIGGREFTGPANVATKWKAYEGSITPIGADEQAKMRGFDPNGIPHDDEQEFDMLKELRELCVSRGMPTELDDAQAQEWMVKNADKLGERKVEPAPVTVNQDAIIADLDARARKREEERLAARAAFVAEVDALCELAGVPDFAPKCRDLPTMDAVRTAIKAEKVRREAENSVLPGIPRVTGEGRTLLRKDLETALLMRTFEQNRISEQVREEVLPKTQRGANAGQWKYAKPMQLAEECLRADGLWRPGMSRSEIATAAMGFPQNVGLRIDGRNDFTRDGGEAYHTTGSFAYLTENAVNKSMMAGYVEGPSTWELLFKRGASVPDFKSIRRYQLSAAGDLVAWPDDTEPQQTSVIDSKESYAVEAYARALTYSFQLLINDDLNALTDAPMLLGNAARRSVNKIAWAPITANPLMRDGVALFSTSTTTPRFRPNLITGAATPTTATIATMRKQMRLMRGENTREGAEGPDILNLFPTYLAAPPSLEETVVVLTGSEYNPAGNFMSKNTAKQLQPIIEPILETASSTAWYLFAQTSQVPTVEVTFLEGHEQPVMWADVDVKTLTRWFGIRQILAAKALDWRGMQKHAGA